MKLRSTVFIAAAILALPMGGLLLSRTMQPESAWAESLTPTFLAQGQPDAESKPNHPMRDQWFKQLNLTADQQKQLQTIRDREKTAADGLRQQMQSVSEQLRSLMASSATTDDQLRQQHQKMQDLMQQMGDRRFETMLAMRKVLTPEQRTKAAELKLPFHGRHHGGDRPSTKAPATAPL